MAAAKLQFKIRKAAFTKKVKKRIAVNLETLAKFIIADLQRTVSTPFPPA